MSSLALSIVGSLDRSFILLRLPLKQLLDVLVAVLNEIDVFLCTKERVREEMKKSKGLPILALAFAMPSVTRALSTSFLFFLSAFSVRAPSKCYL